MTEPRKLIEVPWKALDTDALHNLIESFVLREGTNYGTEEIPLDRKVAQVKHQLETGHARLVFDTETESCHIITESELTQQRAHELSPELSDGD